MKSPLSGSRVAPCEDNRSGRPRGGEDVELDDVAPVPASVAFLLVDGGGAATSRMPVRGETVALRPPRVRCVGTPVRLAEIARDEPAEDTVEVAVSAGKFAGKLKALLKAGAGSVCGVVWPWASLRGLGVSSTAALARRGTAWPVPEFPEDIRRLVFEPSFEPLADCMSGFCDLSSSTTCVQDTKHNFRRRSPRTAVQFMTPLAISDASLDCNRRFSIASPDRSFSMSVRRCQMVADQASCHGSCSASTPSRPVLTKL